jgi:hypothetical protein
VGFMVSQLGVSSSLLSSPFKAVGHMTIWRRGISNTLVRKFVNPLKHSGCSYLLLVLTLIKPLFLMELHSCVVYDSADEIRGGGNRYKLAGPGGPEGDRGPIMLHICLSFSMVSLFVNCTN